MKGERELRSILRKVATRVNPQAQGEGEEGRTYCLNT